MLFIDASVFQRDAQRDEMSLSRISRKLWGKRISVDACEKKFLKPYLVGSMLQGHQRDLPYLLSKRSILTWIDGRSHRYGDTLALWFSTFRYRRHRQTRVYREYWLPLFPAAFPTGWPEACFPVFCFIGDAPSLLLDQFMKRIQFCSQTRLRVVNNFVS